MHDKFKLKDDLSYPCLSLGFEKKAIGVCAFDKLYYSILTSKHNLNCLYNIYTIFIQRLRAHKNAYV